MLCGMLANNYTENFRDTAQSLIWYERSMKHALMSPDSAALGYAYLRYAAFWEMQEIVLKQFR